MQVINLKESSLIQDVQECEYKNFFGSESFNLLQLKKIFVDDSYAVLGIMNKEIFAGYLIANVAPDSEIEIQKIFIKEEFRKKGLGTELLKYLMNTQPNKSIFIEVRESNTTAISFYEKHDFKKISVRKNYYSDGESALVLKNNVA